MAWAKAQAVTAAQYCDFLNHAAASDPDHFFDQKMETDPETACIVRLGTSGKYFYEVIASRENFSVCYVNEFDEEKYCDWLQVGELLHDDTNGDPYLKSSARGFAVDSSQSSQMLSLENLTPPKRSDSFLNGTTITGIGLIFLGIVMVRDGLPSPANGSDAADLTLSAPSNDSLNLEHQNQETRSAMDSVARNLGRPDFIPMGDIPGNALLGEHQTLNLVHNERGELGHLFQGTAVAVAASANPRTVDHSASLQNYLAYLGENAARFEPWAERAMDGGITPRLIEDFSQHLRRIDVRHPVEEMSSKPDSEVGSESVGKTDHAKTKETLKSETRVKLVEGKTYTSAEAKRLGLKIFAQHSYEEVSNLLKNLQEELAQVKRDAFQQLESAFLAMPLSEEEKRLAEEKQVSPQVYRKEQFLLRLKTFLPYDGIEWDGLATGPDDLSIMLEDHVDMEHVYYKMSEIISDFFNENGYHQYYKEGYAKEIAGGDAPKLESFREKIRPIRSRLDSLQKITEKARKTALYIWHANKYIDDAAGKTYLTSNALALIDRAQEALRMEINNYKDDDKEKIFLGSATSYMRDAAESLFDSLSAKNPVEAKMHAAASENYMNLVESIKDSAASTVRTRGTKEKEKYFANREAIARNYHNAATARKNAAIMIKINVPKKTLLHIKEAEAYEKTALVRKNILKALENKNENLAALWSAAADVCQKSADIRAAIANDRHRDQPELKAQNTPQKLEEAEQEAKRLIQIAEEAQDAADEEATFTEMGFKNIDGEDVKKASSCVIM